MMILGNNWFQNRPIDITLDQSTFRIEVELKQETKIESDDATVRQAHTQDIGLVFFEQDNEQA